jgi:hypothetical protein
MLLYSSDGTLRLQSRRSGGNSADFAVGTLPLSPGPFRIAVRWDNENIGVSFNGEETITSGADIANVTYSDYHFGSSPTGGNLWPGTLTRVEEYDDIVLDDAQLEALSALPAIRTFNLVSPVVRRLVSRVTSSGTED